MQENYFTGDVKSSQQTNSTLNQSHSLRSQNQSSVQKQLQSMNLNDQHKDQSNEHEKIDQVDLKQVVVEEEQIQEEKFIESNPTTAAQQKQLGNEKYTSGQYTEALTFYRKSLQYTDKHSEEDQKFRSIIYSNIGLTFMKMRHDQTAIEYFQKSLKLNQKYTKARSNLAQCYENTDKIQEALEEYKKVLEINPNDAYVRQKVVPLEVKVKELQQKRQQEVISGLKNIGNSILGYFGMSLDNFKLEKGPGGGYNIQFKQ